MKKLLMITICTALIFSGYAQQQKKEEIPPKVKSAFVAKFPKAQKVKWSMEEAKEWEAEFMLSGKATSASFDLSGEWLETETEIKNSELPEAIKASIEKQYPGAKMGETALIETPDFSGYEIALKVKGKNVEVHATKEGKLKVNKE